MPRAGAVKWEAQSLSKIKDQLTEKERRGVSLFTRRVKKLLGKTLLEIKLFGSKARGDFDEESDIDILIVVDSNDRKLRRKICAVAADANIEYGCNISPVIYTREEHEKNKYFRTLFIQEVEREGIFLG